jgi:hypothetical protein
MGDRVACRVYVLKEHADQAKEVLENEVGQPSSADETHLFNALCVELLYDEVNYGTIKDVGKLIPLGIPYSYYWDGSHEWSAGEQHLRFDEKGDANSIDLCESDDVIQIDDLLAVKDDYTALYKLIVESDRARQFPTGWDNQLDYGARRRALEALKPKQ